MLKKEEKSFNQLNVNGVGACVRPEHFSDYSESIPEFIGWFELLADNFTHDDNLKYNLPFLFERPRVLHCVGMSIGSAEPLNLEYLKKIKRLDEQVDAIHISDHLCWSGIDAHNSFDLLPLPYCKEAVELVSDKIKFIEDYFGKEFLFENVSTYLKTPLDTMPEYEFINQILEKTSAFLLLDVNNVYVNAVNHKFESKDFLNSLDGDRIKQIHLAGHQVFDTYLLDNHGDYVDKEVWGLYHYCIDKFGAIPTCVEWDQNIPNFKKYLEESQKIQAVL